jgi:putative endonuclease
MLKCADGKYYTGCTGNMGQRMNAHVNGKVSFTASRLPFEVVTQIVFKEKHKAYFFEKYLKSGSGKAFANKRLL